MGRAPQQVARRRRYIQRGSLTVANFRDVNRAIRARFPGLDIEAVRGAVYVYFAGDNAEGTASIYAHPVSTPTADMIRMAIEHINAAQ